jgi:hypothetical protein
MGMQQAGRPGKAAQAVGPVDSPRQGKILGCDVKEVTKSYVNEQRVSGAGSTPINIVEIKQKERKCLKWQKRTEVNDVPSIVIVVLSLRVHCQVGNEFKQKGVVQLTMRPLNVRQE